MENDYRENQPQSETVFMLAAGGRESPLEHLDRMERELEKMRNEVPPHAPPPPGLDKLDAHEETLRNIALKLDSLLADLLEAEAREYTCPEFPRNEAAAPGGLEMRGRSPLEIFVIATLVAAIFLVGMTFGLWGSFFFGL